MDRMRSGIIGTGFIGGVHAAAVRAAGGVVQAVASASPDRPRRRRGRLARRAHRRIQVWTLIAGTTSTSCTSAPRTPPTQNSPTPRSPPARPSSARSRWRSTLDSADRSGRSGHRSGCGERGPVRLPLLPDRPRGTGPDRRRRGRPLWLLHGSYLQDWLSGAAGLQLAGRPGTGGASRAFGDIGVHWCDLMEFVTGHRITRLVAHWANAHAERPSLADTPGVGPTAVATEDGAVVTFETDRGAAGSVVVSQVSLGRKNRLWFSFDGLDAAYVFDQELPDSLWVGGLRENHVVPRGPDTLSGCGRAATPGCRPVIRRATRIRSPPSSQMCTRPSRASSLMGYPLSRPACGPPGSPQLSSSPRAPGTG